MCDDVVAVENFELLNRVWGRHLKISIRTVQVIEDLGESQRKVDLLILLKHAVGDLCDHLSVGLDSHSRSAAEKDYEILLDDR